MRSFVLWTWLAFLLGVLPLGLASTEMWDGVVGMHSLQAQDWLTLQAWLLDSNWYVTYVIFLVADAVHSIAGLPYWVFFKLWVVLVIVGIAFEVKSLAMQVFGVPKQVVVWLPGLVFSFPLWYVFFSYTSMLGHLTCVLLALTGYRLLYATHKLAAVTGIVLLALSFQLASNCAFILAIESSRWALSEQKRAWSYGRTAAILLASLAVYAATRLIWVPKGSYAGYNQFLNPIELASWISYGKYLLFFSTWMLLITPALAGFFYALRISKRFHEASSQRIILRNGIWPMVIALTWIALAATGPYVAVGLGNPLFTAALSTSNSVSAVLASQSAIFPVSVWYGGWGSRHNLLLMVVMVVGTGWLMGRVVSAQGLPTVAANQTVQICLVASICMNLAFCMPGHWAKLLRLAQERTVVSALAEKPLLPAGQVELLMDSRLGYVNSIYEANYLLYRAYQMKRWVAVMLPDSAPVHRWVTQNREFTLNQPLALREKVAGLNLMGDYNWDNPCLTVARVILPELTTLDVLWRTEHAPDSLPAAQLTPVSTTCAEAELFWKQGLK